MIQYTKSGIIRRIDDLGRIVIPRELRRQCKVEEGDPFEIIIGEDENGNKCFVVKPYKKPENDFARECTRIVSDVFDTKEGMNIALFVDDMLATKQVAKKLDVEVNSDFAIRIRVDAGDNSVVSKQFDGGYVYAVILRRRFEPYAILAAITADKISVAQKAKIDTLARIFERKIPNKEDY